MAKIKRDEQFDEAFLRRLDYLYIMSKRIASGALRAQRRTKVSGSGLEFADFREYTPGDETRNIDWKVYARTNKLFLKLFEEEEDLHVYFLLDNSRSMRIGAEPTKFDYTKKICAALGYIGLSNLDRVGIVPFSSKLDARMAPTRGKNQIFKIFDFLSAIEPGDQTNLEAAARVFVTQHKRRGKCIVISDFYDPQGFIEGLNLLRYHKHDPIVIHLYDERELSPTIGGELRVVDCESGEAIDLVITPGLLKRYRQAWEQLGDELERFCAERHVLYFRVPIQLPFDELVLRVFRAGGFLT